MQKIISQSSFLFVMLFFLMWQSGCQTTPVTNRRQMMLIPERQELSMGVESYQQILKEEKLSRNKELTAMVQRVGKRIAAVAGRPDYDWEFNLLESPKMNAFALPGGKVAIYEGILPTCENEAGLAVVMSHEIAHVLARHGGERMSQSGVVSTLGKVVSSSVTGQTPEAQQKILSVYGAASQYGFSLPFSRKHESEADHIGLILMAKAGYDPREAPRFWQRFSQAGGDKPPEFMSTHPADERRASDLEKLLPVAMAKYDSSGEQYALGAPIPRFQLQTPLDQQVGNRQILPASARSFQAEGQTDEQTGNRDAAATRASFQSPTTRQPRSQPRDPHYGHRH